MSFKVKIRSLFKKKYLKLIKVIVNQSSLEVCKQYSRLIYATEKYPNKNRVDFQ